MKGVEPDDSAVAQRTRKILDASAELFGRNGYAATSMDDIAEAAGVNKATIYYHLGKKSELYNRILLEPLEDIQSEFETLNLEQEVPERLAEVLEMVQGQLREHPELSRILLRSIAGDGTTLPQQVQETIATVLDRFKQLITAGQEVGLIRQAQPETMQKLIVGGMLVCSGGEEFLDQVTGGDPRETNSSKRPVELLLHGLVPERKEN